MAEEVGTNWHPQVNEKPGCCIRITTGLRAVGQGRMGPCKSAKRASENPSSSSSCKQKPRESIPVRGDSRSEAQTHESFESVWSKLFTGAGRYVVRQGLQDSDHQAWTWGNCEELCAGA